MGPRPGPAVLAACDPAQAPWVGVSAAAFSPGSPARGPMQSWLLPSFGSRTVPFGEGFPGTPAGAAQGASSTGPVFRFHCARGTEHSLLFSCLLSASATRKQALPERVPLCLGPVSTPAPGAFQEVLPDERGCWQDPLSARQPWRSKACRGAGPSLTRRTHSMKAESLGSPLSPCPASAGGHAPGRWPGQVVLRDASEAWLPGSRSLPQAADLGLPGLLPASLNTRW